jgi:signal transduction histidine kinase
MRAGDRVMGALTLVYGESEREYFKADLRFAQELADRAGMAVQNARLYRDAEDALRVRDEFLGTISHDLRTPLTTIRGLTELLLRQVARPDVSAERLARSLQDIDGASRVMTRMIENLLDLSRSEAGRPLTLNLERVDLAGLLRDVVNAQQRSTERHRIELSMPEDDVVGYWDEVRLERVMHNLLSNAIKYSPEGGRIGVSVACYDGESEPAMWAEIRVEDEGIGIPAGDIPRIFERHFRAGNVTKGMPGLGIGLAGVAQSVDQHGGSIHVESEEGRGSRFVVRLPINPNPPEPE